MSFSEQLAVSGFGTLLTRPYFRDIFSHFIWRFTIFGVRERVFVTLGRNAWGSDRDTGKPHLI